MFKYIKQNKILLNKTDLNIEIILLCNFDCKNKLRSGNL